MSSLFDRLMDSGLFHKMGHRKTLEAEATAGDSVFLNFHPDGEHLYSVQTSFSGSAQMVISDLRKEVAELEEANRKLAKAYERLKAGEMSDLVKAANLERDAFMDALATGFYQP